MGWELGGARVLITGAASGIGLACAEAFAAQGCTLILSDIDAGAVEQVGARLGARLAVATNISSAEDVANLLSAVEAATGGVDVLINNAGIGYLGAFEDTAIAEWQRVIDINVIGMVRIIQAFLPGMRRSGQRGAIVNIASTAGFAPTASMSAYAASKHAVVGLSEVLAMELHDTPIAVTIVAPGIVNTNIVKASANMAPTISPSQIERLQAYYDSKGCAPDVIARDIVRGVERGTPVVHSGPYARLLCTMIRLSRCLARRVAISSSREIGFLPPAAG